MQDGTHQGIVYQSEGCDGRYADMVRQGEQRRDPPAGHRLRYAIRILFAGLPQDHITGFA